VKIFSKVYAASLFLGIIIGLFYPANISTWIPSIVLVLCFFFVELYGFWGLRNSWSKHRIVPHMWYTIPVTFWWLGIHLGLGNVGSIFIYLGLAIS